MKTNHVRAKLKNGEPSIGTWLTLPTPFSARQLAGVGFDWLTVELEHSPTNWETAAQCFLQISAGGVVPLTRLPWNTGENIKRALDSGAWGVIVPMVNSKAEAEAVVENARYNPLGNRSVGGQLHAISFGADPASYYEKANDEVLVIVMAEHVKAIENLDDILSVPGIDAVFIGPNDLHKSMGLKPSFESDHPQFVQALEHVRKTATKYGIAPGIHVADAAAAQRRRDEGFQFIAVASDIGLLLAKGREVASALGLGKDKPAGAKY